MAELILAAAFMLASHVGLSSTAARARLTGLLGRRGFLALYSVISLGALVWMITAYGNAPFVEVWPQAAWTRWVPLLLMPLACVLWVAGVSGAGTTISSDGALPTGDERGEEITGILKVTRHPVMWGFILWAGAHIPPNGDVAGLVLFGAFLALALAGPWLIDAKRARLHGPDWERFARATSAVPFAAIAAGRARVTLSEIGWSKIAGGLALYGVLLAGHEWGIGVTPYP
ncbi:MAG: NnrU family protein [Alphaproteobacteria bacterium]|nr:NnrU family protein [Alphaproteobacteria bacterium]